MLWSVTSAHCHDESYDFSASFQASTCQGSGDDIRKKWIAGNNHIRTWDKNRKQCAAPVEEITCKFLKLVGRQNRKTRQGGPFGAVKCWRNSPDSTFSS